MAQNSAGYLYGCPEDAREVRERYCGHRARCTARTIRQSDPARGVEGRTTHEPPDWQPRIFPSPRRRKDAGLPRSAPPTSYDQTIQSLQSTAMATAAAVMRQ